MNNASGETTLALDITAQCWLGQQQHTDTHTHTDRHRHGQEAGAPCPFSRRRGVSASVKSPVVKTLTRSSRFALPDMAASIAADALALERRRCDARRECDVEAAAAAAARSSSSLRCKLKIEERERERERERESERK